MGEIHIYDDILAPSEKLDLQYGGKNPFLPMNMIQTLYKDVMKIATKDIHEFDVRWDGVGENRDFYGKWKAKRKEDRWTVTNIFVTIQGSLKVSDKTGTVKIGIKGYIETKYPFSNFIQRSFWWFYNYAFYYKQRRMYLEFAKDNMFEIKQRLQEAMNISQDKFLERSQG